MVCIKLSSEVRPNGWGVCVGSGYTWVQKLLDDMQQKLSRALKKKKENICVCKAVFGKFLFSKTYKVLLGTMLLKKSKNVDIRFEYICYFWKWNVKSLTLSCTFLIIHIYMSQGTQLTWDMGGDCTHCLCHPSHARVVFLFISLFLSCPMYG